MAEEKEVLNLTQKLSKIREICDVVVKGRQGYGYKYADLPSILVNITAGMNKYGVSLIPSIIPDTVEVSQNVTVDTKVAKNGNTYDKTTTEMLVKAYMNFRWVNDDNPKEFIDVPWFMVGAQSDPSQAGGSAISYYTRYFLTSFFQIPLIEGDVDEFRSQQQEIMESEERAIAEEIVNQIDILVNNFVKDNPKQRDAAIKFIGRYIKGSDYTKIKDPNLAAKLLQDFKDKFLPEENKEEK